MSTPTEPFSPNTFVAFGDEHLSPPLVADPNNPPWGVASATLLWVTSVITIALVPSLAAMFYVWYNYGRSSLQNLEQLITADDNVVLVTVVALFPVHIITLVLVWATVSRFGTRPFWPALGWSWSDRFGLWTSVGFSVLTLLIFYSLASLIGGDKTDMERIIENSTASRFGIAFLATFTAPLVEELVYRGVLYSAMQRAVGRVWAITGVSVLFMLVHVPQYHQHLGVIVAVAGLSLVLTIVRAVTGRLLPCFVIHLVFNGIQSILIVLAPYLPQPPTVDDGAIPSLIVLFINSTCAFRVFV